MRVAVDMDLCESNALCMAIAPEVFELDSDDILHVIDTTPDDALLDKVAEAIRSCPKHAISATGDVGHSG
jgi:ferredoxin